MKAAMPKDAPVNVGAPPEPDVVPSRRVSEMQVKLHRWATADPGRRFDDLFNFVHDPATLLMAFERVAGNAGAKTPGVDGLRVADVEELVGVPGFLDDLRARLRLGTFEPLPVRERKIPKPGRDDRLEQSPVEVNALLVDPAYALREYSTPAEGHAICVEAEVPHDGDILAESVVVIRRDVSRNVVSHLAGSVSERIPDGCSFAVFVPCPFDLEGARGDTELEVRW